MKISMVGTPSGLLSCPKCESVINGFADKGIKRIDLLTLMEDRIRGRLFDSKLPFDSHLMRNSLVRVLQLDCSDDEYSKHLDTVYETSSLMCVYFNHMYLLKRSSKSAIVQTVQELIEWIKAFNILAQSRLPSNKYLFTHECYVYFYGDTLSMTLPYEEVII